MIAVCGEANQHTSNLYRYNLIEFRHLCVESISINHWVRPGNAKQMTIICGPLIIMQRNLRVDQITLARGLSWHSIMPPLIHNSIKHSCGGSKWPLSLPTLLYRALRNCGLLKITPFAALLYKLTPGVFLKIACFSGL